MLRLFAVVPVGFVLMIASVPGDAEDAYRVRKLEGYAPTIDGKLGDPMWENAVWDDGFDGIQGGDPSQRTAFAMVYDEEFIYLGIALDDDSPAEIVKTPGDRDVTNGDRIATFFDTNVDGQSSYVFVVNAAGVVRDQLGTGNGQTWDNDWDVEWESAVAFSDEGWTAELRIPFSSLGGADPASGEWGLQLTRIVERFEEQSLWNPMDPARGWTGSFGRIVFER